MTAENLTIREFDPKDVSGIVEVHCSLIEKWWKNRGRRLEAAYEDLSPLERWGHGGWWLTEEFALPYEKWLNEKVGKSFVAEIEENGTRRIVGHCDLVFSKEPYPWRNLTQLEIIAIHKEYQKRSIGSALVRHTLNIATEIGYPHYVVFADDEEIPIYRRQGLERLQKFYCNEIETSSIPAPQSEYRIKEDLSDKRYSEISDYLLVTRPSGDFAANYIWSKNQEIDLPGFGKPYFLKKIKISWKERTYEIILSLSGRWIEIWMPPEERDNYPLLLEILRISTEISRSKGVKKISSWIPEELAQLIRQWGAKTTYTATVLHKRLTSDGD